MGFDPVRFPTATFKPINVSYITFLMAIYCRHMKILSDVNTVILYSYYIIYKILYINLWSKIEVVILQCVTLKKEMDRVYSK
jgi:hypothetical protein